jgi:hypothetical protein
VRLKIAPYLKRAGLREDHVFVVIFGIFWYNFSKKLGEKMYFHQWYLPAILAFAGTVWGVLRLISARLLKSRFAKSSIDEQQETLQTDMRKIQQLMYSPLAFLMSCGILFPLLTLILIFYSAYWTFQAFAHTGVSEFVLFATAIERALFVHTAILGITLFIWALYFFLNHAHRKLILDMCCLAGTE